MKHIFPYYSQHDAMDCGPACLRMIAKHYGRHYRLDTLRAAENIGFKTLGVHITAEQLKNDVPLPCIVHWKQCHFVVLYKIRKGVFYVADPAHGLVKYHYSWI